MTSDFAPSRPPASVALPALSGGILALAYLGAMLPWEFPFTGLVGFVPLLLWVDGHRDRGWRDVRRAGIAFGLGLYPAILYWFYSMLAVSWLAVFAYLGLALVFTAGATAALLVLWWTRRLGRWPFAVLLPAAWLSMEWLEAQTDLRMTAQHVAHAFAGTPFLVQFADLGGPYGVGLAVLMVNALLYAAVFGERARRRAAGWTLAALVSAILGYDAFAWTHPPEATGTLRVGFVQPNVPLSVKMNPATDAAQWAVLARLTQEAAREGAELVVWPETARPSMFYEKPDRPETRAMPDVQSLAMRTRTDLVIGTEYTVERGPKSWDVYNAVFAVGRDGKIADAWTAKTDLVPFVEGIPFRPVLGPVLDGLHGSLRWLAGGFSPGRPGATIPVGSARVGATVCFEELFFDLQRSLRIAGANLQVVVTNHAWFRRTGFQRYAANTVRLRAIENRSSFVRAANTGISGFVDPLGRFYDATALFTEAVGVRAIPLTTVQTPYDEIGDAVAYAALLVLTAAVAAAGIKTR